MAINMTKGPPSVSRQRYGRCGPHSSTTFKHNLWREGAVSCSSDSSPGNDGRRIIDGAQTVRIFTKTWPSG